MTTPPTNPNEADRCPCKWCGQSTPMTGTQECDPCWHLRMQIDKALREVLEAVLRIQCIEEYPAIYSKARQAPAETGKDT